MGKWVAFAPAEDTLIRRLYPDYAAIMRLLPTRSRKSLEDRAQRLGVATKRNLFSALESKRLARLRSGGATWREIKATFPGRSMESLKRHAGAKGMVLKNRRLAKTGDPATDEIRRLAVSEGITLAEFDLRAGSGTYFRSSCRKPNGKHIAAGAQALGLELYVEWPDEAVR